MKKKIISIFLAAMVSVQPCGVVYAEEFSTDVSVESNEVEEQGDELSDVEEDSTEGNAVAILSNIESDTSVVTEAEEETDEIMTADDLFTAGDFDDDEDDISDDDTEEDDSNKCGENVTWLVEGDTLFIQGKGECWNYWDNNDNRWQDVKKVVIENGVTTIGSFMFYECVNIDSISIPASVVEIGDSAFGSCRNLKNIQVAEENKIYSSVDGCLYNKDQTRLIYFVNGKEVCNISSEVTSIGDELQNDLAPSAFYDAVDLQKFVVDPNNKTFSSVDGILYNKDQTVLLRCPNAAENLVFSKNTKEIGTSAVSQCNNITSVTIPEGVTKINKWAFDNCVKLTSVTLPKSLTSLGSWVFNWNNSKLVLYVHKGSYAEKTVKDNKTGGRQFQYKVIESQKKKINKTKITVGTLSYTGTNGKPSVTVKNGSKTLRRNTDYTISYSRASKVGAMVKITITGKGSYTGKIVKTVYIVPRKPTISSVKSGKKNMTVIYKKTAGASGYQIAYSTNQKSGYKYVTLNNKTVRKTISRLTSGKKYYVKVRAYRTINGKKYYGNYSAVKSVKIK